MNRSYITSVFFTVITLSLLLVKSDMTSANELIHACLTVGTGQLRIVSDPSECKKNESAISWNEDGLQGDPGPAGPQGTGVGVFQGLDVLNCNGTGATGKEIKVFRDFDNDGEFDQFAFPPAVPDTIITSFVTCPGADGAQGAPGPAGPQGTGVGVFQGLDVLNCNGTGATGKEIKVFRDFDNDGMFDQFAFPPDVPDTIITSFVACPGADGAQGADGPEGPQGPPGALGSWTAFVESTCSKDSFCTGFTSCPNEDDVAISCSCGSTLVGSSLRVVFVGISAFDDGQCVCTVRNQSNDDDHNYRRNAHCVDSTP